MAGFFNDQVNSIGELEYQSNSSRKITVAGFEKGKLPVVLIWYKDQIPGDELKWDLIDITIKGVSFKDPVYVEMISGKVYEIDKSALGNSGLNTILSGLPVWDSPILIAERSQVLFNASLR